MWYDRNANGVRDANVRVDGMGSNVEFTHGLGGVTVRLVECFPGDPGYYGGEDEKTNLQQKQDKEQNAADAFAAGSDGSGEGEGKEEISLESYAGTVTLGYDVKMHSGLAGENEQGGKYNLINIKINRSYYIYATSTEGYLFTTGICNDDYPGWECKANEAGKEDNEEEEQEKEEKDSNSDSAAAPSKRRLVNPIDNYNSARGHSFFGRLLGRMLNQSSDDIDKSSASNQATEALLQYQTMGIPEGRSDRCVNIDRRGLPDFALNMGVMHIADPHTQKKTEVKLSMDIETVEAINNRRLVELIKELRERKEKQVQRKRALRGADDDTEEDDENYFLLEDKDIEAIGSVTAEVIATTLQPKLKSYGIELNGVLHKNVAMNLDVVKEDSEEGKGQQENASLEGKQDDSQPQIAASSKRTVDQLVVDLEVRGHYQPPPHLDFDYIVEQSINSEQFNIRRELVHYNQNCENQRNTISTLKLSPYDFKEINSWRGTRPNRAKGDDGTLNIDTSTFRMACSQGIDIPDYLDPATADIALNVDAVIEEEVEKVMEVPAPVVEQQPFPWIMVTAIPIAGVLLLVLLLLVYKRGGILRKKNNKSASDEEDGKIAVISPDDCDIFPESYADNWDEGKGTGDAKVEGKMAQEDVVANKLIQDKDIVGAVPSNSVDGRPANKKSAGLFGALSNTIRRELSNIQAALRSEQGPSNHNVVQDQNHSNTATSALDDTFTNRTEKTFSTIHNINGNNNNNQDNDALPLDSALDKVLEEGSTRSRVSKQTSRESTKGEGSHVEDNSATQPCIHEGYERKRSQGSASSNKKSRRKSQESERSCTNSDPSAGGHDDGAEEAPAAVAARKKKSKRRSQDLDRSERSDFSANDKKSANNRRRRRSSQEQLDQSDRSAFSGSLDESNTSRLSSSDLKKKSSRRKSNDLGKSEPSSCCVIDDSASSNGVSSRRRKSDLDNSEPSSAAADEFSSRYYSKDIAKVVKPKRRSRQLDRLEEPVIDDPSDGQDDVKSADSRSGKDKPYRKLNVEIKRRSTANESVSS